jgi:serine/threonine protein phosphatase PrpC
MGFRKDLARDPSKPILLIVSDGMGGHVGGAEASDIAVKAFVSTFIAEYGSPKDAQPALDRALIAGNEAIHDRVERDPDLAGMGCTLSAILYDGRAFWVSVGDSPVWVVRQRLENQFQTRRIDRVNRDHSLRALLMKRADEGLITREEAETDRRRNQLRSALVGGPLDLTDAESVDRTAYDLILEPGERIVLASDGIETLTNDEIAQIAGHSEYTCQEAANKLLSKVLEAGNPHQDNTTIIVFQAEPERARKPMKKRGPSEDETRAIDISSDDTLLRPPEMAYKDETVVRGQTSSDAPTVVMRERPSVHSRSARPRKRESGGLVVDVVIILLIAALVLLGFFLWQAKS